MRRFSGVTRAVVRVWEPKRARLEGAWGARFYAARAPARLRGRRFELSKRRTARMHPDGTNFAMWRNEPTPSRAIPMSEDVRECPIRRGTSGAPGCAGMFPNVPECAGMCRNVPSARRRKTNPFRENAPLPSEGQQFARLTSAGFRRAGFRALLRVRPGPAPGERGRTAIPTPRPRPGAGRAGHTGANGPRRCRRRASRPR